MADRFSICLAETLKWEGGYSDHPADPGGPTMNGIIQRVYDGWRDQMGLPRRPVREIEPRERDAIYRQNYWTAVRGDELPPGIDVAVYDFGVNSGPPRAVRALQKALGINPDGHVGPATIAAAQAADPAAVVQALMTERRRFLRQVKTFGVFGKGWMRRCDGIEAASLACCRIPSAFDRAWETSIAGPLDDADAQSETQGRATPPAAASSLAETSTSTVQTGQIAIGSGVSITQGLEMAERVERLGMVQAIMQSPVTLALVVCGLVIASGGIWQLRDRARKLILGV